MGFQLLDEQSFIGVCQDPQGLGSKLVDLLQSKAIHAKLIASDEPLSSALTAYIHISSAKQTDTKAQYLQALKRVQQLHPLLQKGQACFIDVVMDEGSCSEPYRLERGHIALCKTACLEYPKAYIKAIELENTDHSLDHLAKRVCDEILCGGTSSHVVLGAKDKRFIYRSKVEAISSLGKAPLKAQSVVLVTGGAKGVTAQCLLEMAKHQPYRFVLIGRSKRQVESQALKKCQNHQQIQSYLIAEAKAKNLALTPVKLNKQINQILSARQIESTLEQLCALGSQVHYEALDCQELEKVKSLLQKIRQKWGCIDALIHAAGVLQDQLIVDLSEQAFTQVYDTKVKGALNLLQALSEDQLQLVCFFTSVSGCWGNRGQVSYSIANQLLNHIAVQEQQRRPNCVVKALNWGPWDGGMVDAQLKQHFLSQNIELLPLKEGAQMFVQELAEPKAQSSVEVVLGKSLTTNWQTSSKHPVAHIDLHSLADSYHLQDHSIKSQMVFPFALAIKCMQRYCEDVFASQKVSEFFDIKNCKGLKIKAKDSNQSQFVSIGIKKQEDKKESRQVEVQIFDQQFVYYKAWVVISSQKQASTQAPKALMQFATQKKWYDGEVLFHGPRFQVLSAFQGEASTQAAAQLSVHTPQISANPYALDGALQAAVLQHWQKNWQGSLPTEMKHLVLYEKDFSEAMQVRVELLASQKNSSRVNLELLDDKGYCVCKIEALKLVSYFQKPWVGEASQPLTLH